MRITAVLIAVGALLFVFREYIPENLRDRPLAVLGATTVVVAAVVVLIRVGQHYQWTGFGESVQPKSGDQEIHPRKTLWDWLQLFIVPLALAAIGLWFSAQQDAQQQRIEAKRAESEQQIEKQRAQDAALQAYLDQMSQLMLEGDLRSSKEHSEVRTLARARTQTVLGRLDSRRKGSVVQFLYEASLIDKEMEKEKKNPVVSLSHVPLRGANLSGANLHGADLIEADLIEADLSGATLYGADLSGADLDDANLSNATIDNADLDDADLSGADLSETTLIGADMGDGANLTGAILTDASLDDADLSDAYLFQADLSGATLYGADLSGARLDGAKGVTEEQLKQVKTN
jgi:uncharacterized protein YjbI with pentapeptide repeats